ncbi:MAG: hypothetical protein VXU46_06125 [Planctomycetota bacterium]|nr:hypothetical protein [Planctomycetota bacterium]
MLLRLRIAIQVGIQTFRQLPDAKEAFQNSCNTGHGWNALDFGAGFVDLSHWMKIEDDGKTVEYWIE